MNDDLYDRTKTVIAGASTSTRTDCPNYCQHEACEDHMLRHTDSLPWPDDEGPLAEHGEWR